MIRKKNNYHTQMLDIIDNLDRKDHKLLLHACCGPCFTIPYEYLKNNFKVDIYFNNSNIYPYDEYKRRLEELKRYTKEIDADVEIIIKDYDNENYMKELMPLKEEKEGSNRCFLCYKKRLEDAFDYAYKHGYEYVTSVMSISRYKNSNKINEIGFELEKKYKDVKWLCSDFKKDNGYEKSIAIIKEHQMYFQHYCGCQISYQNYLKKQQK